MPAKPAAFHSSVEVAASHGCRSTESETANAIAIAGHEPGWRLRPQPPGLSVLRSTTSSSSICCEAQRVARNVLTTHTGSSTSGVCENAVAPASCSGGL